MTSSQASFCPAPEAARRRPARVPRLASVCFALLWLFIGATSSLDMSLAVWAGNALHEENPAGKYLLDHHGMAGLAGVKMMGTILVLGALLLLHRYWRKAAWLAIAALSLTQLLLMGY